MDYKKVAILGARRGLGQSIFKKGLAEFKNCEFLCASRKMPEVESKNVLVKNWDFSKQDQWKEIVSELELFQPQLLIYTPGGGPFGNYMDKGWKDHKWAYNVTFLFPAFLIHSLNAKSFSHLKSSIFIGSDIAEDKPDFKASSYCAAKHALRGLISVVHTEVPYNLGLFSPGYMDTDLLPKGSFPRLNKELFSPDSVAEIFFDWLSQDIQPWHYKPNLEEVGVSTQQ